jgi:hypothetical protein
MFAYLKAACRLTIAAGLVALPLSAAFAQVGPRIAVPESPGGYPGQPSGGFAGCYAINQDLYGPYRMSFCLDRNGSGSYRVTGGGLYCNGWLNWWQGRSGEAQVSLQYTSCGRGVGWSADRLACVAQQPQWPPFPPWGGWGWFWQGGQQGQPGARIVVPEPQPANFSLRCSYQPAIRGYQPISVIASRVH